MSFSLFPSASDVPSFAMYSTQDRLLLLAYVAYSDECSSHLMVSASRDRRPSSPFGGLVVSHVRKWFSVPRTPHAQSVSPSSSTCAVFPSSGRSPYAHGRVAPSTGEEVMFHCTCWPLVGTPGAYCCCFAVRSSTCPSAISSQGVSLRRRGVELLCLCGKACGT